MLIPNVLGTKEADFVTAEEVASLGYAALVADIYGQGKRATHADPDLARFMLPLNADRQLLKARLESSLAALKAMPQVDPAKTAAIGFCFGGKCVLDMVRGGLDILAGVSFHGVYDSPPFANVTPIKPKLLVCHGWEDPLCPPEAVIALGQEMTEGGADWQIHAYGGTGHAFTDKMLKGQPPLRPGFGYHEDSDRRSWKAMQDFLAELFA